MSTNIDSVMNTKRKARREASYGEYNPWGGSGTRRSTSDAELGRRHSEKGVRSADLENNEHVLHTSSMPVQTSTNGFNSAVDTDRTNSFTTAQRRSATLDSEKNSTADPTPIDSSSSREHATIPEEDDDNSGAHHGKQTRKQKWRKLLLDDPVPWQQQLKSTLFPRWLTINWLLLFVPIGIGLHFAKVNALAIFLVNFVAIIPLAAILSFATEEIALRVGETLGGLLNASFG